MGNISHTVLDLEAAGYQLAVDGNTVLYTLAPGRTVDETLAYVLLDELKEHEEEAVAYLQQRGSPGNSGLPVSLPAELFRKITDQLAAAYLPGCIAWTQQHRPDLQQQIDAAEETASQVWLDYEAGAIDIDDLKTALAGWYRAYRQAILAYTGRWN